MGRHLIALWSVSQPPSLSAARVRPEPSSVGRWARPGHGGRTRQCVFTGPNAGLIVCSSRAGDPSGWRGWASSPGAGGGGVILTARESRGECPPEQGADIPPSLCTANALRSAALLIFFNKWSKTHTELLWNTWKQARYFCFQEFKVAPLRDFISNIHHFIWKYCQTSIFKVLLLQPESLWKRGIFSLIIKVTFDLRGYVACVDAF